MRRWRIAAGLVAGFILCGAAAPSNDPPPDWAFVIFHKTDDATPPPKLVTVPGSKLTVTLKAADDRFNVPDWFPQEHAKPPAVVLHGRAPDLWACSYCHRTTGAGGPENAVIAGLPTAYIEEQFAEFSSGRRHCAVPAVRPCGTTMNAVARTANAEDIKQAAAYYSRLPYRSRIKVVEAAIVPKTEINHFTLARSKDGGTEPIGHRILELPDEPTRFENGDWHATFTAYVPPGSIARGRELVQMGRARCRVRPVTAPDCKVQARCLPLRAARPATSCASYTTFNMVSAEAPRSCPCSPKSRI